MTDLIKFVKDDNVQKSFDDILKDKSRVASLTASIITIANTNGKIKECVPQTVVNAALKAAALNLPIDPALGQAAVIPYKNRGVYEAQFQIQWKGWVQLALRSKQYKTIAVTEVFDGQLESEDPLRGNVFNWNAKKTDDVVGYVAYFQLHDGFEKMLYMTHAEVKDHAERFSTAYQYDLKQNIKKSQWSIDFDSMGKKTVIKLLIDKWGPKSTDLIEAITYDQSVIKDTGRVYADNLSEDEQEEQKAIDAIAAATDPDELTEVVTNLPADVQKKVTTVAQDKFRELSDGTNNS